MAIEQVNHSFVPHQLNRGFTAFAELATPVSLMLSRATSAAAAQARAFSTSAQKRVVLVDGVRTPFAMSGTIYKDYIAQDLGRMAIKGLLTRTAYEAADLDYIIYGNVIQEGKLYQFMKNFTWFRLEECKFLTS